MSLQTGKSYILTPMGTLERQTSNIAELLNRSNTHQDNSSINQRKINVIIPKISSDELKKQLNVKRETKIIASVKLDKTSNSTLGNQNNSFYIGDHTEPKAIKKSEIGPNYNSLNINTCRI